MSEIFSIFSDGGKGGIRGALRKMSIPKTVRSIGEHRCEKFINVFYVHSFFFVCIILDLIYTSKSRSKKPVVPLPPWCYFPSLPDDDCGGSTQALYCVLCSVYGTMYCERYYILSVLPCVLRSLFYGTLYSILYCVLYCVYGTLYGAVYSTV